MATILSALALIMVRSLNKTEGPGAIAHYFVLASMICGVETLFCGVTPDSPTHGLLMLFDLFGGFGHFTMTLAFHYAEASRLAPFEYVALLWQVLADVFIFKLEFSSASPASRAFDFDRFGDRFSRKEQRVDEAAATKRMRQREYFCNVVVRKNLSDRCLFWES
ncbi:hypothetical protein ACOTTU_19030 [Roseobacter sp. EG26]|uniref:hypothetical protein n=1 Tax=Roseobacter sp. EG26 TaxID=3412477 RepID=UPI003CE4F7F4